jgi:mono/diheme cytochrome c family protein
MKPSIAAGVAVFCSALAVSAARAPSKNDVEGRVLYTRYCASCHGLDADGHGPVASVLVHPTANLRRLAEQYGRPLPRDRIARWIDGREELAAHGTREMPVWGERFHSPPGGLDPRIRAIVTYLESIQPR